LRQTSPRCGVFLEGLAYYFYPIDSVPMSPADWRQHFGLRWPQFFAAKLAYDLGNLLAPGQGIFSEE
jgi:hypothetical protein